MEELNEQQLEAVNATDRTILCLAAAGCGKTKTLISRVARLVKSGVDPTSILCLTFTNAAAFEMKERYKRFPEIDLTHGVPEFRTFHSFCYSLLIKDKAVRERIGYSKIPEVAEDNQIKEIKAKIKLALNCKLTDEQLETGKLLTASQKDERELFQKAFAKQLKKENVITFDMMCYNVGELFVRNEECVKKYKEKYHYLCCDEFQDTDAKQFKFIASFPKTTNFFMVGDILQNLYTFRGTSNEYIKQLTDDPNWRVIKMYKNYRSTRQICNFANKFSKYSKDDYRIEMEGQRDGDEPEVIYGSNCSYVNPVDPDHLSILIKRLKENKNECAILCRTNKECNTIRKALTNEDIQFSSRSKSSDALDYLDSALSNEYMLEWLSTKLDAKNYGDYIRLSAISENPDIRWFLNMYGNDDKVRKPAEKIIEIRNITSSTDKTPAEKFEAVTKLLRSKTKCKFEGNENTSNKEIIEMIKSQIKEIEECPVYCGTIHSVKGLEYDTVYVMGVNDGMFRLGTEEMNNLAYVAYTRAKSHLVIFRR